LGFLKFLKRGKTEKEELDELDLPPAPPPLDGIENDFPDFDEKLPDLPEFPDFGEKISAPQEMPKFDFPEEDKMPDMGQKSMPEFPSFPEMEETEEQAQPAPISLPPAQAQYQQQAPLIPRQMPEPQASEEENESHDYQKMPMHLFAHERASLRQRPTAKMIYVRIDSFKAALGNINIVRSDLRKSDEALNKLEGIKSAKDKSLDKVKSSLDDLQKKLIFIDKTLFKGD